MIVLLDIIIHLFCFMMIDQKYFWSSLHFLSILLEPNTCLSRTNYTVPYVFGLHKFHCIYNLTNNVFTFNIALNVTDCVTSRHYFHSSVLFSNGYHCSDTQRTFCGFLHNIIGLKCNC